jgi:2-iminobutanoate/2-iminopropanoate deaminase
MGRRTSIDDQARSCHGPGRWTVAWKRDGARDQSRRLYLLFCNSRQPSVTNYESSDTKDQARQAFENLKVLLGAAGAGLEHVVKVTLYLQDLRYRLPFHDVWMEYYPKDPPARIAIQVADANAQPGRNAHFALDVIALDPNA